MLTFTFEKKYFGYKNIRCYGIAKGKEKQPKEKVLIHICAAHVMKTITNKLATLTTNKDVKKFYAFVFARMVNSVTLKELTEVFKALCKLSLSPCSGKEEDVSFFFL